MSLDQPPLRLLRRRAASQYLQDRWAMRASEQTLAKYAVQGCGPEFQRYSRDVVYTTQELDEWARTRLSKSLRSTSQTNASGRSPRDPLEGKKLYIDPFVNSRNRTNREYLQRLTKEELIELLLACPCGAGPP
jgi:hypothetical protein